MKLITKIIIVVIILVILFSMKEGYMNYQNCVVDGVTYRCDIDKDYPIYPGSDSRYLRFQIPEGLKGNEIKVKGYYA